MISITAKLQIQLFLVLSMSFILRNVLMKYDRSTLKQPVYANKISYHSLAIAILWRFKHIHHTGAMLPCFCSKSYKNVNQISPMNCHLTSRYVSELIAITVASSRTRRGFESRLRILTFGVCSNTSVLSVWIALQPSFKVCKLVSGLYSSLAQGP